MPENSWLIVWDQSGKASIHSRWSLKFVEMSLISESEINALCAHVDIVGPMASSVLPTHDATSAVLLQKNLRLVLQGGAAPQQHL